MDATAFMSPAWELMDRLVSSRIWLLLGISAVSGALVIWAGAPTAFGVAVLTFGQGVFAFVVSGRVYRPDRRSLLIAQLVNAVVFVAACVFVIQSGRQLVAASMMQINGLLCLLAGGPLLAWDYHKAYRRKVELIPLRALVTSVRFNGSFYPLMLLQGTNSLTASADSWSAGLGGLQTAGAYQAIQRPLLGLGGLNSAVGQLAVNALAGRSHLASRTILLKAAPAVMIWPALGLMASVVLRLFLPSSIPVSMLACAILGLAFGLGAVTQISGTLLLVMGRGGWLSAGALVQLVVICLAGFALVSHLGVLGVVLAVLASRFSLVIIHLLGVRSPVGVLEGAS
jgi:hypothetical protein